MPKRPANRSVVARLLITPAERATWQRAADARTEGKLSPLVRIAMRALTDDVIAKQARTISNLLAAIARLRGGSPTVADFGAVGDGIADDTAAIQAACDAAVGIYGAGTSGGTTYKIKRAAKGRR